MKTRKGILSMLYKLNDKWNPKYTLWAASGTLLLVETETGKVIDQFWGIDCDGGDPGFDVDENGTEYICLH